MYNAEYTRKAFLRSLLPEHGVHPLPVISSDLPSSSWERWNQLRGPCTRCDLRQECLPARHLRCRLPALPSAEFTFISAAKPSPPPSQVRARPRALPPPGVHTIPGFTYLSPALTTLVILCLFVWLFNDRLPHWNECAMKTGTCLFLC